MTLQDKNTCHDGIVTQNLANNPNYYSELGRIGGSKTHADGAGSKGFAANRELARTAGKIGGQRSRKGKK